MTQPIDATQIDAGYDEWLASDDRHDSFMDCHGFARSAWHAARSASAQEIRNLTYKLETATGLEQMALDQRDKAWEQQKASAQEIAELKAELAETVSANTDWKHCYEQQRAKIERAEAELKALREGK